MLNKLLRAFVLQHAGVDCRRCGESVGRHDHLGLAESVCSSCR
jgi:formylmethanofuran dehydrogenase subunit E